MPLTGSFPDPHGVTPLANAYCKIVEINLNYQQQVGRITVNVWQDKPASDAGLPPVTQVAYPISPDGTAPTTDNPAGFPKFADIVNTPVPTDVLSGPTVVGTTPMWECVQDVTYQILQSQPEFRNMVVSQ